MKPIAFIDVDGVLNRLLTNSAAKRRNLVRLDATVYGNTYVLWMDPADKQRLERLEEHFELAWGTTWEDEANRQIAPFLGLPEFPIVAKTSYSEHTKAYGVLRAAEGRPFVWLDDMAWMTYDLEHSDANWKLVLIDPEMGLTDANIDEAIEWAQALDNEPVA